MTSFKYHYNNKLNLITEQNEEEKNQSILNQNTEETAFVNLRWQMKIAYSVKTYRNTEETTIVYTFTKNESGSKYATWFKRQLK